MKILALSDIHGYTPNIPDCDLLLLAGDYVHTRKGDYRSQIIWFDSCFKPWLNNLSKRMKIVFVAGNHDYILENYRKIALDGLDSSIEYLEDSSTIFNGYKIYGSPQNLRFYDWSFNKSEEQLEKYWSMIPEDTDILLLHQPPYGYADWTPYGNIHTGSHTLLNRIYQLENLKLIITGHLHSNYGIHIIKTEKINRIPLICGCYVDENYEECGREPISIELENKH